MQVANQRFLFVVELGRSTVIALYLRDKLFLAAAEAVDAAVLFEDDERKDTIVQGFHFASQSADATISVGQRAGLRHNRAARCGTGEAPLESARIDASYRQDVREGQLAVFEFVAQSADDFGHGFGGNSVDA